MNKIIQLQDVGNKDYEETWEYQKELFKSIVDLKIWNRRVNFVLPKPNYFLFVENPHAYTLGKSGDLSNLCPAKRLARREARHL